MCGCGQRMYCLLVVLCARETWIISIVRILFHQVPHIRAHWPVHLLLHRHRRPVFPRDRRPTAATIASCRPRHRLHEAVSAWLRPTPPTTLYAAFVTATVVHTSQATAV